MCDFCEKIYGMEDKHPSDDYILNDENGDYVLMIYTGDSFCWGSKVIKFCPICGRSLEEEKELPWVTVGNWKPIEAKQIGNPKEKSEVTNFEPDWEKNLVCLEDDCK